jgi:hypothetical protein
MARIQGVPKNQAGPMVRLIYRLGPRMMKKLLALVNLDRFNAAFRIGSAGFSEGVACVAPDRPGASRAPAEIA